MSTMAKMKKRAPTADRRRPENNSTAADGRAERPSVSPATTAAGPHGVDSTAETLAGLHHLLALEERARKAQSAKELYFLTVNETRRLTGARQAFLLKRTSRHNYRVVAVSSVAILDRDTPLIRWIEGIACALRRDGGGDRRAQEFDLPAYADPTAEETRAFPFAHFLWHPLMLADGTVFGGFMQTREKPWNESDIQISERLSDVYAHAWRGLSGPRRLRPRAAIGRWISLAVGASLVGALFLPVPMTALAPVEVVAHEPFVVAAPLDGVIEDVPAPANKTVRAGDVLFRYVDTTLRNQSAITEQEARVAEARYLQATQGAFSDAEARHRLGITRAEHELKIAELNYARERLAQATVRAPRDGLLIHAGKAQWKGRPVTTGERIMEIADPRRVALRIDLPVADAIVLKTGARVRVFLDSAPLNARHATVTRGSYHAVPKFGDTVVYDVRAVLAETETDLPRIGARGTAQLHGQTVSLGFFLFRRPIAAARQHLGF